MNNEQPEKIIFVDSNDSLSTLRSKLLSESQGSVPLLECVLALTNPSAGHEFLQDAVMALEDVFASTSIFVAHRLNPRSDRVRVLAARRDRAPREPWEYSLEGNPCQLAYNGQVALIPCDLGVHFENKRDSGYQSFIGVPLLGADGSVVGHIALYDEDPLDDGVLRIGVAQAFAARAAAELEREALTSELQKQADSDPLTALLNRRGLYNSLSTLRESSRRSGQRRYVALFDLDSFKLINDRHGHAAGDNVLVHFARCLSSAVSREDDLLARTGGDEFVVLFATDTQQSAERMVNSIVSSFESTPVIGAAGAISCTVSYGLTEIRKSDFSIDDALVRADSSMYAAKSARSASARR